MGRGPWAVTVTVTDRWLASGSPDTIGSVSALRCPTCGTEYPESARFCVNDGTALVTAESADPLIGTKLDGRYLVLRKLGEGGMGAVYEGVQLSIDRQVAIKVIKSAGRITARQRQRLWLEARAVSRLEHPNVVRVYDYGTGRDDDPFLVMELLRGRSLSEAMDEGLPFTPERAKWIVAEAARGLAAAHRAGLVHRDVKPTNLWLQDEDNPRAASVKVLDFGLVTGGHDDDRITTTGDVVGTPAYMCPEQIEGRTDITPAADVYALGALLHELLVGKLPYDGASLVEVLTRQLSDPVPDTREAINGAPVPDVLRIVWKRALAKNPSARYQNAGELLDELSTTRRAPEPTPMPGAIPAIRLGDLADLPTQDVSVAASVANLRRTGVRRTHASAGTRERKRVTVLSVTLADFDANDPMDLEDRIELAGDLIDAWADRAERAGGSVDVVEGHGLRATWGLPTAREDDTRRALDVALLIATESRAVAYQLALQAAIHTDSMLAELDPDSPVGYRLVGDPWRVAEEAAATGSPRGGQPVLTGRAFRTLRRAFVGELPRVGDIRGDSIYRVEGGRTALATVDLSGDQAEERRTVGRDRELARITRWGSDAIAKRQAGFHVVVGEAGIGKSHLLVAAAARLSAAHSELSVLPATTSDREDAPYAVFRRLLLGAAGHEVRTGDAVAAVERWITATMSRRSGAVGPEPARAILGLVGLSDDSMDAGESSPQGRRGRGFESFADLFAGLAAQGGLLLLLDDLHAADAGSLELIDYLLADLADFPVAILGFGRPVDTLIQRYAPELELTPLPDAAALALANELARSANVSRLEIEQIVGRAAGNPLFLEELVRAAIDGAGTGSADLPESLHAMLRARYDAQPESVRTVLQHAAVVGSTFWSGAVEAQVADGTVTRRPVGEVLADVRRAGFVRQQSHSLFGGETEYEFAQSLMRDVAYEANLRRDRKQGHKAVAQWLLKRGADLQPAHLPVIADHLEKSGDAAGAAKAWLRAADAARDRDASAHAATGYARALDLQTNWQPGDVLGVRFELGAALQLLGRRAEATDQLRGVADSPHASATQRTDALVHLSRIAGLEGRVADKTDLLEQAEVAAVGASRRARITLAGDVAFDRITRGQHGEAADAIQGALAEVMGEQDERDRLTPMGNLYLVQAILAGHRGDLHGHERAIREALRNFQRADNAKGAGTAHNSLCICLRDLGRHDEAAASARMAAQLFKRSGIEVHEIMSRLNLAWSRLEGGYPLRALQAFQRVREDAEDRLPWTHALLADVGEGLAAFALDLSENAERLAARALERAEEGDSDEAMGWAQYAAGVIRRDGALLEASAAIWRRLNRSAWLLRALRALATHVEGAQAEAVAAEIAALAARLGLEELPGGEE